VRMHTIALYRAPHASAYYPAFDWLRATLASTVFLSHSGAIPWHAAADLAVQVFFALSGFLIRGILLACEGGDLPRFYFNRATRIWMPYGLAIALLALVTLLYRDPVTAKTLEFFLYKLTFVYNVFGPSQLATFHNQMPLRGTGNHFWSIWCRGTILSLRASPTRRGGALGAVTPALDRDSLPRHLL
jgi:peptidoglycan/LPS O-acetylase OafA/YrhL